VLALELEVVEEVEAPALPPDEDAPPVAGAELPPEVLPTVVPPLLVDALEVVSAAEAPPDP
jgi:hypothetical protein